MDTGSVPSDPADFNIGDAFNSKLDYLDFDLDPQQDVIREASESIDDEGIKDGLKHDGKETLTEDKQEPDAKNNNDDATSEAERKLHFHFNQCSL